MLLKTTAATEATEGRNPSFLSAIECKTRLPVFLFAASLKLLLVPAYFSTDFDVHRNWLAITHHLPPTRWYWDETSVWTLDYPPVFAYFQWLLAKTGLLLFSALGKRDVAEDLLRLTSEPVHTPPVVLFQRLSVILFSDGLLFLGLCTLEAAVKRARAAASPSRAEDEDEEKKNSSSFSPLYWLLLLHPGLTLVDSLHFQYNGLLFGLFFLALAAAYRGRSVLCGLLFLMLVLTKHLFLVLGPVVAAYLLATTTPPPAQLYEDDDDGKNKKRGIKESWKRLLQLTCGSTALVLTAFAPVLVPASVFVSPSSSGTAALAVVASNLKQLLSRLFPFDQRGLVHSYWASNLWALYMAADKVVSVKGVGCRILGLCGSSTNSAGAASPPPSPSQSGPLLLPPNAVNSSSFLQSLPQVKPGLCAALTLLTLVPVALLVFRRVRTARKTMTSGNTLLLGCALSYAASFLFGWHTHEKAVLYVVVPLLALLAIGDAEANPDATTRARARTRSSAVWILHLASCLSLFPLIFTSLEQPFVIAHAATYSLGLYLWLEKRGGKGSRKEEKEGKEGKEEGGNGRREGWLARFLLLLRRCFYLAALVALVFLETCYADALPVCSRLPFAPLMLVSVVCSLAIVASFASIARSAFNGTLF